MSKNISIRAGEPPEIKVTLNGRRLYPKGEMIKARLTGVKDLNPIVERYHGVYFVDKASLIRVKEWVLENVDSNRLIVLDRDLTPEQFVKRVLDDKKCDYRYLTGHHRLLIDDQPISDNMIQKLRSDAFGLYRVSGKRGDLQPHPLLNSKEKFEMGLNALCFDESVACNPMLDYINSRSHADVTSFEAAMSILKDWIHQPLHIRGGRSDISELVSWRIIVSIVARQKYPGVIIRNHPVIIGGKGAGKTAMVRELLPPDLRELYYQPSLNISDKNSVIYSVMGRAVVEVAEMGGIRRADANYLKAFLSEGQASGRLAYQKNVSNILYTHTIVGTANEETDPLPMDRVAAQRWIPIWVDRRPSNPDTQSPVEDYMEAERDKLYAAGNMVVTHLKTRSNVERFIMTLPRELEVKTDRMVEAARYNPDSVVEEELWEHICRTISHPPNVYDGLPHYTYLYLCENCSGLNNIRTDKRRAGKVLKGVGLKPIRYNRSDVPPARMWFLPKDRYLDATKHSGIYSQQGSFHT